MKARKVEVAVYRYARAYARNGGVSMLQAFLKHSLVPLRQLVRGMPKEGIILDLGCGEGILANLVARALPDCQIRGFDLDGERVALAQKNAAPNAKFEQCDILDLPEDLVADGVILNDVVHHNGFRRQWEILASALRHLRPGGQFILKEVDRTDKLDLFLTKGADSRLYTQDDLSFRTEGDWIAFLRRLGLRDITVDHVRHPYPASRTLFFARRPEDDELQIDVAWADAIGAIAKDAITTIFVTGATGFIGWHLALKLLNEGLNGQPVRLIFLARDPETVPQLLISKGAVPLYADLTELPRLRAALRNVDYVFHLAAEVKLSGGADIFRNNLQGTLDILEAVKGVPIKRFIYASTVSAVDRAHDDPCLAPLDEAVVPHPLSDYGRSKLKAEKAVIESGLPYSILRIPWGYGAGMTPETHTRFLLQGVANRKLFSWFNFPGKVSLVAATDLVEAFLLLAARPDVEGETYFVSDGRPVSLGNLFRQGANILGMRAGIINIPHPLSAFARKIRHLLPVSIQGLNSNVFCVSNAKILALGFKAEVPLRQGLVVLLRDMGLRRASDRHMISLVTGAASGIGRALAERLSDEGHALLLVDRDHEGLKHVAESLSAKSLTLDLTSDDAITTLEEFLETNNYQLDWVVNNAGAGIRGGVSDIEAGLQEILIDLNCKALTSISRLALRQFQEEGHGTLINLGSSAGFQPFPLWATYSATKAYVQNFTRAVLGEVQNQRGITVMLANPSGTKTNFQKNADGKLADEKAELSVGDVARIIVDAAYHRRSEITIGLSGRLMKLGGRLIPMPIQIRMWAKIMSTFR